MKTTLFRFIPLALLSALLAVPALGIKITVPKQYEDQVEAIKKAEAAERERQLQTVESGESTGSEGLNFTVTEEGQGNNPPNEGDGEANGFLQESIAEATNTAMAFQKEAPENMGFVSGQVVDKESGLPVAGVAIILDGTDIGTITDSDGRYTLGPAPARQYTLNFVKSGYIPANVADFTVVAGEVSVFPFALPPRPAEMSDQEYVLTDFTVTADEANDMMLKLELKMSSDRTLDIFSSEDFSKFAASDVADAVKRVAGVSVNEGKFPSVRGLNDRYTVTTLNGMPVPSPDPFRKSPQFDLFPSSLLDSIVVSKSASADLSGESTAANFDLITKQMPEEFFLKVSLGAGWHSGSIDEFRSFDQGGSGYLYTDGASLLNQAPRPAPNDVLARNGFEPTEQIGSEEKDPGPNSTISLSLGNKFEFANDRRLGVVFAGYHKRDTSAILDAEDSQNYDFSGADTFVTEQRQLPPFLGGGFVDVLVNRPIPYGDESIYDHQVFEESVKLGSLLGLAYELGDDHTIFFNAFTSRTSDTKVTRDSNGRNPDEDITKANDLFLIRERLYYVERTLTLGQFGGEHLLFPQWSWEPEMDWTYQKARTTQDEPDFRDTIGLYRYSDFPGAAVPNSLRRPDGTFPNPYNVNSDTNLAYSSNSWRFVQEDEESKRVDFDLHPFEVLTLEAGGMFRDASRSSRIQSYIEQRADLDDNGATVAGLGPSQQSVRNGNNSIRGSSEAEREIDAYYLASRYEPTEWAKINFGYRLEDSIISVSSNTQLTSNNSLASVFRSYNDSRSAPPTAANLVRAVEADVLGVPIDPAATAGNSISRDLIDRLFLPSANLSLDPTPGVQVKLGYYETINRPSFREITGDIFIDTENGDFLAGNPFLASSTAANYDFRLEFYPEQFEFELPFADGFFSGDDMIGISLFYKEIENPIEFIRPTDNNIDEIPFNNPEGATAEGVEFEFRKNLAFIGIPYSEYFSIGGNLSLTDAKAGVSEAERSLLGLNINTDIDQIDDERPLTEQPDRIINLDMTFSNPDWGTSVTLAYNKKSEILESIGSEASFDAFRGAVERLDLIVTHEFESGLTLRFAVKNLLDDGYETYFVNRAADFSNSSIDNMRNPEEFGRPVSRQSVDTVGRTFSLSASYPF